MLSCSRLQNGNSKCSYGEQFYPKGFFPEMRISMKYDVRVPQRLSFVGWSHRSLAFRSALAAVFLVVLTSSTPHQVHHIGGQFKSFLGASQNDHHPRSSQNSSDNSKPDHSNHHQPITPQSSCTLQIAGKLSLGCYAYFSLPLELAELFTLYFPATPSVKKISVSDVLSIRAPPSLAA